ncbi:hypothetical protein EVAR_34749_1 [Eumeta japonica]|uniref:Uncharacterized protein n=1 Tax=Eumeta variegata TaxID=151549 RepID=A0A4C1YKJ7_EUMVA|nr:hypothetical protein EVAR_34749_1 [Eumeta japonica]
MPFGTSPSQKTARSRLAGLRASCLTTCSQWFFSFFTSADHAVDYDSDPKLGHAIDIDPSPTLDPDSDLGIDSSSTLVSDSGLNVDTDSASRVGCVRPLSLFYSDASADGVEETSHVLRSRSRARLRRNATMSHAFSSVQPAFIDL